jgi:nucleoside-diphosphate-sugar epimerase
MATLVTGAFGCIGAWVCKRLLETGERPVAFDVGDDPWRTRMILGPERLRDVVTVKGDIADLPALSPVVGEHKIPSMGFRPHTVYGPGRDFGLTVDPTLAMKSAVLGRPFQIRWGGATDLIYADDVARACIAASTATLEGARVYNLHGDSAKVADIARLIEEAWPSAKGTITHVEQAIPFPSELADPGYQQDLGPAPRAALKDGIRKTLNEFAALKKAGRLDGRELEPAK